MATQVFISYRGDDSAGSTGRVHDGLVRRADDALLLGAPVLGKYAPQSRDLRVDVTLPSRLARSSPHMCQECQGRGARVALSADILGNSRFFQACLRSFARGGQ